MRPPVIDLTRRRRPEGCLSDLVLDRLRAGEPAGREGAALHLAGCAGCARRLAELRRAGDEDAPLLEVLRRRAAAVPNARVSRRRWVWLTAPALATAAVLLALLLPAVRPRPETRSKGGPVPLALEVVVRQRDGRVAPLGPEGRVHPGDRIRFVVSAARPAQLVVLGLDSAGQVTVYSSDGARPRPVAQGAQVMPGSILLDDTLGAERLVAVACAEPFAVAEVVDIARRQLERAGGDPRRVGVLARGGCREATVLLNKSERP